MTGPHIGKCLCKKSKGDVHHHESSKDFLNLVSSTLPAAQVLQIKKEGKGKRRRGRKRKRERKRKQYMSVWSKRTKKEQYSATAVGKELHFNSYVSKNSHFPSSLMAFHA